MGAACCTQEGPGREAIDEQRAAVDILPTLAKPPLQSPRFQHEFGEDVPSSLQPATTPRTPAGGGSLVVEFEVPETRQVKLIVFEKRPLGLDFDKVAPVSMKRVHRNGHAEEKGVEKGWIVKTVNGIDVAGKDFPVVHELLVKECAVLPHVAS
eukprot:TRINITY_DN77914_c0_g1_i1.p1 TRINITY_DN77914_c0_g1~~TRINITY_DN77914_c0_g1_i1.p1  ORF type:complete len:153 (+),score=25.34 TRINITY_DN77914_c0_g1_i1:113-571(+)